MSRTLTCPGPPEHTFEHKGGRGRPPKYCDEHKPVKPQRSKSDTHTISDNEETNPFIKKAKANLFIEKAQATKQAEPKPVKKDDVPPVNRRPRFTQPEDKEEIIDTQTYNDAGLPGVKIHDICRDTAGKWSCKITLNEETFELIENGGWIVKLPSGGKRHALPHVAAAIQARVRKLTPHGEQPAPKKREKPAKTLEQVAEEVVPMPHDEAMELVSEAAANDPFESGGSHEEAHRANMAALEDEEEQEMDQGEVRVCECCEYTGTTFEPGWKTIEEVVLCPNCAKEIEEDGDITQIDDILSAPEKFDEPYADFAEDVEAGL